MSRRLMLAAGLGLALVTAACASSGEPRRRSTDVITREEIEASTAVNMYDLIQQLRPQFLRSRGPASIGDPRPVFAVVYLDDIQYGDLATLRSMDVRGVAEVRFLSGPDATTRWGTGHVGGAIMIRSMSR